MLHYNTDGAMAIYRWILPLGGKKGIIDSKLSKKERAEWKIYKNKISHDPYYLRLWKPIYAILSKDCEFCRCKCKPCEYSPNLKKLSKTFGIDTDEIRFLLKYMTVKDINSFKKWMKKVDHLVPINKELQHHDELCRYILKELAPHMSNQLRKTYGICVVFGIEPKDVRSEIYSQFAYLIRKYDYLDKSKLLKICSTGAVKHVVNFAKKQNAQYNTVHVGAEDITDHSIAIRDNSIDTFENHEYLETLRANGNGLFIKILLGEYCEAFYNFLLKGGESREWNKFYKETSQEKLLSLVKEFLGGEFFSNKSRKGELKMKQIVLSVPKKECVHCGHFVSWHGTYVRKQQKLRKKGKKVKVSMLEQIMKDCSPAYPSCPVGRYELIHAIDELAVARQIRQYMDEGEDDALSELLGQVSEPTKLLQIASNLDAYESDVDDDEEFEDNEDDDVEDENSNVSDQMWDILQSKSLVELIQMAREAEFDSDIPPALFADEDKLREFIFDKLRDEDDASDNGEEEEIVIEDDDEDDDSDDESEVDIDDDSDDMEVAEVSVPSPKK